MGLTARTRARSSRVDEPAPRASAPGRRCTPARPPTPSDTTRAARRPSPSAGRVRSGSRTRTASRPACAPAAPTPGTGARRRHRRVHPTRHHAPLSPSNANRYAHACGRAERTTFGIVGSHCAVYSVGASYNFDGRGHSSIGLSFGVGTPGYSVGATGSTGDIGTGVGIDATCDSGLASVSAGTSGFGVGAAISFSTPRCDLQASGPVQLS